MMGTPIDGTGQNWPKPAKSRHPNIGRNLSVYPSRTSTDVFLHVLDSAPGLVDTVLGSANRKWSQIGKWSLFTNWYGQVDFRLRKSIF